jgi:ubiquinone/menaquinone biosynthesis C-methylase UbiE
MSTHTQWDSAAKIYDEHMGESGDALNHNLILPVVEEFMDPISGLDILDVGCGSGYVAYELAQRAHTVVGTDFSSEFISICQKKYKDQKNVAFLVQDLTKPLEHEDNAFDRILCKMVLQYVPDIALFAKESARVLKPKGRLIVVVDHPFHVQMYYAQQCVGIPSERHGIIEDYFSKTPKTKLSLWNTTQLTWYPRTVSDYIQPFIDAKLTLTDIREVAESDKTMTYPRILALCFKK